MKLRYQITTVGDDWVVIEWPGMNAVYRIAKSEYRAMDRLKGWARKNKIKLEKKIKEDGNMDLVEKYLSDDCGANHGKKKKKKKISEGGPYRGMSVHGLASHIKKKYGRSVKASVVMDLMAEEGLHGDDDWPDMEDALASVGVKIKK